VSDFYPARPVRTNAPVEAPVGWTAPSHPDLPEFRQVAAGPGARICPSSMRARVYVTLKPGVLDPAGKAVASGLHGLGFPEVQDVRLGRFLELEVDEPDAARAKARVEEMARRLLANTVMENFRVELG
jgi:phosphoribosylformylglycinamidine synthase PurS subunit